jgi:hypothetical protein
LADSAGVDMVDVDKEAKPANQSNIVIS